MAQLVRGFFYHTLVGQYDILRQAVKTLPHARQGDDGLRGLAFGEPEDKIQVRHKQVEIGDGKGIRGILTLYLAQDRFGRLLPALRVPRIGRILIG